MKKLILSVFVLICVLGLIGCNSGNDHNLSEPSAYFVAKVTEVNEGSLFVEVIDNGTTSLGEGTAVHVSTNFDGYTECTVGDCIRIEFDGLIQELYPPIIPNVIAISKNQ